jgi:DNA polymerase-3 subunit gamma/tau
VTLIARLAAGGMRDAESILDQLLATTADTVTEATVRDLLGLADAAAVDGFIDALRSGDVAAGVAILDRLEERGRDPRALLDQVVDGVRARLVAEPAGADGAALAEVARRLVAIDPDRAGIGGLRLQLELALFAAPFAAPPRSVPASAPTPAKAHVVEATAAPPAETAPELERASAPEPAAAPPRRVAPASPPTEPAPASLPRDVATPSDGSPSSTTPEPEPVPTVGAAAAAADAPSPAPGGTVSLDHLVRAWPDVVTLLSRQPAVKPLILVCRPVALDGAIVTLGFPEEQAFLRDVAERKRGPIEAGIGEVIGRPVSVRCVVANVEIASAPTGDDLVAEARRIFGADLVDVGEVN